jgi:hypothetical protein
VVTLHDLVGPPSESQMVGTEVRLSGVRESDVASAKDLFLRSAGCTMSSAGRTSPSMPAGVARHRQSSLRDRPTVRHVEFHYARGDGYRIVVVRDDIAKSMRQLTDLSRKANRHPARSAESSRHLLWNPSPRVDACKFRYV